MPIASGAGVPRVISNISSPLHVRENAFKCIGQRAGILEKSGTIVVLPIVKDKVNMVSRLLMPALATGNGTTVHIVSIVDQQVFARASPCEQEG